ncbi:MAG: tetratricopeptide repeat protein [Alphaproteobacteria bacterium]|nr:tetratricopeptide repeat protein [Alphaproteobacteria bacterium]
MTDRDQDRSTDLLIQEVDEDLKREQYAQLWKRHGGWLVGAALAVIFGVAGHQGWKSWQTNLRQAEAGRFAQALELARDGKAADAAQSLSTLARESRTGYQAMAALTQARLLAESGNAAAAAAAYEGIAADQGLDRIYRDLALIHVAYLTLDGADPAQLERRIEPLVANSPWRHSALEISALLAQRRGDIVLVRQIYKRLADDGAAPPGMRQRATEMLAALGAADGTKG